MEDLNKTMNDINWLISLLVAIPLSIAGNMLTPLFQNWRASKSKNSAQKRLKVVEQELDQASKFSTDAGQLNTYLLVSLLGVILLFALPNVFGGVLSMLYAIPAIIDSAFGRFFTAFSGMLGALLNLMAVMRAEQALTIYHRVREFEKYKKETESLIEQLKANAS